MIEATVTNVFVELNKMTAAGTAYTFVVPIMEGVPSLNLTMTRAPQVTDDNLVDV